MRVRLKGNHSKLHCGCAAVWQTLRGLARAKGWKVVGRRGDYDALIVNGEGTMHHSSEGFHKKMKLLQEAIGAGKQAYLLNTVWQENSSEYDDILRQLSGISVREVLSQKDLLERHGIQSRVSIDLSYFAPTPMTLFHRRFGGRAVRTDFWLEETNTWGQITYPPIDELPEVPMTKRSWPNFIATLKTAGLLVTGRQHAVYGACRARLPFAASEGNTHKVAGLIATSGIDLPYARTVDELPDVITAVQKSSDRFTELFRWMEQQSPDGAVPAPGEKWPVSA